MWLEHQVHLLVVQIGDQRNGLGLRCFLRRVKDFIVQRITLHQREGDAGILSFQVLQVLLRSLRMAHLDVYTPIGGDVGDCMSQAYIVAIEKPGGQDDRLAAGER